MSDMHNGSAVAVAVIFNTMGLTMESAKNNPRIMLLAQSILPLAIQLCIERDFPKHTLQYFNGLRKALAYIRNNQPGVVIAEFVYAPTYGSQLSNFEALFATLQTHSPKSRLIALVATQDRHHVAQLRDRLAIDAELSLPLDLAELSAILRKLL